MSRTTKVVGFTVPAAMAEELSVIAQEEQRTKSELFREMFRVYRTYRRQLRGVEEERIEQLIGEEISERRVQNG